MLKVRLLAALVCVLMIQFAYAKDWPQWRGPNRDGKLVGTGLKLDWTKNQPKHLWTIEGMGRGYASLSAADGKLYTTGNLPDGQAVICVDVNTKELVWSTPLTNQAPKHGYPGSRCTPTLDGEYCYVVTSDGEIVCLKSSDGEVVWRRDFKKDFNGKMMSGWGFSESPLVDGDWVLCTPGGQDAIIVALDKKTGKDVWRTSVPNLGEKGKDGAGYSSIVVSEAAGVKQYVQLVGKGLIGVRASDGKLLWNYNRVANGTANIPTPVPFDDHVFASTGYGTGAVLVKLSRDGSGVKATEEYFLDSKTFQNHHGGMIQEGEYLYAGHQHNKGFPICLHIPTGKVQWLGKIRREKPEMSGSAAITYVDGQIIFRYQNGTVALVQATPDGFELNGSFTPDYQDDKTWSHPVVYEGKLYLREQDKLMCYEL
ncbi:PQQ-binding-like beta-propeller repeat protein [Thalassoglobus polymorphus]|uniref:Outer membrane biogenesis protein BamB n=1 Tax=Thalassoglobus polymorphus TaxID=2527994 RepID=A0A517QJI4_9PLAN|nr:PQQ-binding-like beta-propeller repeat protein [Thalassoglobus polymorphus]QDT31803.1 outer membrane biogenesis protein BamB [Thalassoglobus polymorphus]